MEWLQKHKGVLERNGPEFDNNHQKSKMEISTNVPRMNETRIPPESWKWTLSGPRKRKGGKPRTTLS